MEVSAPNLCRSRCHLDQVVQVLVQSMVGYLSPKMGTAPPCSSMSMCLVYWKASKRSQYPDVACTHGDVQTPASQIRHWVGLQCED